MSDINDRYLDKIDKLADCVPRIESDICYIKEQLNRLNIPQIISTQDQHEKDINKIKEDIKVLKDRDTFSVLGFFKNAILAIATSALMYYILEVVIKNKR